MSVQDTESQRNIPANTILPLPNCSQLLETRTVQEVLEMKETEPVKVGGAARI